MNDHGLKFTKVEAVGNHFVLIDAFDLADLGWPHLATTMCARHFGVGADGLLVLQPSGTADFGMRMFNPDGTEDVCGNGMRCAAAYIYSAAGMRKTEYVIEAKNGLHPVKIKPSNEGALNVRLDVGRPSLRSEDIPAEMDVSEALDYPLNVKGAEYRVTCVSVGTPHAVICAPRESFWEHIPSVSEAIETHPIFPERVSVTWCDAQSPDSLTIRTWERGVGPTLGCGTGASAALVAAHLRGLAGLAAKATSPGGTLEVEWPDREDIFITGTANIVYRGSWVGGGAY